MPSDPWQHAEQHLATNRAALRRAQTAAGAGPAAQGVDVTGMAWATLDERGRLTSVHITAGWRTHLAPEALGDAEVTAAHAAAGARLQAWAAGYTDPAEPPLDDVPGVEDDFAGRMQQAVSGTTSDDDSRAGLLNLLAMAEALEAGLDEIAARLGPALAQQHTGRSAAGQARVTVTGGGALHAVRYDQRWLRTARESDIARQTRAAATAAYTQADRAGPGRLIADSRLGALLQQTQDPLGLARQLRLRD